MTKILAIIVALCALLIASCTGEHQKNVAIQPYGSFDKALTDSIKASIEKTYAFSVITLSPIELPKSAFTEVKSPRYRADTLIRMLAGNKGDQYDHILGLTLQDISTTKRDESGNVLLPKHKYKDWGVFGLGYRPGASCIVSTFRLNTTNRVLLLERLKKVCNHELGHNLGLPHCESSDKCVMKDAAETIRTIDQVDLILCNECKSKIQ